MKISIVGPSKQFFSGLTVHTILLANALSKHHQVSVVLLRNLLPRALYPGRKHVGKVNPIVDFAPEVNVFEGMDWNWPLSWYKACKFLRQQRPEAIIMLWWSSAVAHMQLSLVIANKIGIKSKLILEIHETVDPLEEKILPIKLYSRLVGRLIMAGADGFTVHSNSVKSEVIKAYGIPGHKVFVKPFGVYVDYERAYDKNLARDELKIAEKFVILCFGSIRKYKGVPYLVEAFSILPEYIAANSRLIIAGEDWGDDHRLKGLVESSPYNAKITYDPTFVPDDMVPKYFSAADVVVLPYLRTSGSGVANIAMAHNKPIITSSIDTMQELLSRYSGASFASPGDSGQIMELLQECYKRVVSGDTISCSIPENTWDEVEEQYVTIIRELDYSLQG